MANGQVTDNGGNGSESPAIEGSVGLELEIYGGRAEIKELSTRILTMLPSARDVGKAGAVALAQVAIAMQLNPFVGEVWAIPQKGGTFTIMPGIKGIRRKAHEKVEKDNGYYTVDFRRATEEELEGLIINKGDIPRACDVRVISDKTIRFHEVAGGFPKYTGIGLYRKGEPTKMLPLQVARKRAESDALKQAFDLPLPVIMGPGAEPDDQGWDVVSQPTAADHMMGEAGEVVEDNVVGEREPVAAGVGADQAQQELFDL